MPLKNKKAQKKLQKTKLILMYANAVVLPLLIFGLEPSLALILALIINLALISSMHEIGKQRRPGSNAINFFAGSEKQDVENTLKNIVNGGSHIHNQFTIAIEWLKKNTLEDKQDDTEGMQQFPPSR